VPVISGSLIENQILPPIIFGIVAVTVEPEAPSGMAQLAERGAHVEEGDCG